MSTDLYEVRVMSVEGDRLTYRVTALDDRGTEDPPASRTVGLQILWEPWDCFRLGLSYQVTGGKLTSGEAEELGRTAPIGRELAGRDICDGDWMRANVGRFIRSVEVHDRAWVPGDPPDDMPPSISATCVITVTDPRWLHH